MKCGRRVCFHGAFLSKAKAERKESSTPGAFIKRVKVRGKTRFVVMTGK